MEKGEKIQREKIEKPGDINKNCWLVKTLNYTPYKRCQYCKLNFRHCLFLHYQIISLILILFLFTLSFLIEGNISKLVIIAVFTLVIVYGYFFNKSTDKIIQAYFAQRKAKEALEELAEKLEEQVEQRTKELEIANERLKELDKAKSEFVSIASHQLRTPITAVKGYTSMILEGTYGPISEKIKSPLEKIFESSNRLVHMITDFLTLSRIERGKIEYNFQKTDLKGIVVSVMDEFKAASAKDKKKLDLSLDIDEKEDYALTIDAEKIRQVIYNIIENAMKYTHQGFVKVSLDKNKDKSKVIVKIHDSGAGLSKESLEKIFQKFSQANNQTGAIIGVGLGLYVAKEIMKAHNGDIRAESKGEGTGSTFYIQLPADFVPPKIVL